MNSNSPDWHQQDSDHVRDQGWEACPPGALHGLSASLRRSRNRQHLRQAAAVGGTLVLLFAAMVWMAPQARQKNHGGISCSNVLNFATDYVTGQIDVAVRTRIREHLVACPKCREKIQDLKIQFDKQSNASENEMPNHSAAGNHRSSLVHPRFQRVLAFVE